MTEPIVFRPRRSSGQVSLVATPLLILLLTSPALVLAVARPGPATLVFGVIPALIALPFLLLATWYPSMRYELDDAELHLRYGPLVHYRIPLRSIQAIERRDLEPSIFSSLRLPGFALAGVRYVGIGPVRMVATAAATNIVLLHTDLGLYGITPADDIAFVDAIRARTTT